MKSILLKFAVLSLVIVLIASPSCKKESDPFDDDARKSYEAVISLQEEALVVLTGFEAVMDSASAVEELANWFRDTSLVESVLISSQGLSVKYSGGIWGGIVLNPERSDEPALVVSSSSHHLPVEKDNQLKNIPSDKSTSYMAASYSEFPASNDRQNASWKTDFQSLGYGYAMPGEIATNLNYLAQIEKSGNVLCLDSHGYAWPANNQVSEVFFKTGEEVNNASTSKYYEDILEHNIIMLQSRGETKAKYYIGPGFITKYNDFSKDTVLFYGGFCYSFLGNWPSIVDACASGTYFGFDWSVRSSKCADWAIDLVDHLADQSAEQPWTVEGWMTSSTIDKQYFDASKNKTIHILYNGNGALTLWKAAGEGNGTIVSTSSDGAPVTAQGFTCTDYVLKCLTLGQLPENVGYDWDYGDGNTYYTVNDNLALYHHWALPQTYHVKVILTDISTQTMIMEVGANVSFIYPDFLPEMKSNTILEAYFGPDAAVHFSGNVTGFPGFSFNTEYYDVPLSWSDSSFSAQDTDNNDYETITIEGNVSSDGRTLRHCLLKKLSQDQPDHELTLEITELPVMTMDPINCINSYYFNSTGSNNQAWLTRVEYKEYDPVSMSWISISSIDWSTSELSVEFRSQ